MKNIILIFCLVSLFACDNLEKDYYNKEGFNVLAIDKAEKKRKIKLSSFVNNITYIPLETNSKVLIGKQGNGHGEYCSAHDFALLPNDTIILHDRDCKKLQYYHKFNFINSQKLDWFSHSFAYQHNKFQFYMQKIYTYNRTYRENYDLITTNSNLTLVQKNFKFKAKNEMRYDPKIVFRKNGNYLNFTRRFNNKVYKITEDKISPAYFIDFGNPQVPYNLSTNFDDFNKMSDSYSYF